MADTDWNAFTDATPAAGDKLVAARGGGGVNLDVEDFLTRAAFADSSPASGDKLVALRGSGGAALDVGDFLTRDGNGDIVLGEFVSPNIATTGAVRVRDAVGNPSAAYVQWTDYGVTAQYGWMRCRNTGVFDFSGGLVAPSFTPSDHRLKDISGPVTAEMSGRFIDAARPVQGVWRSDGRRFIGLIAHEQQAISETVVTFGEKDGPDSQALEYASPEAMAMILAELKFLRGRVAALEAQTRGNATA